MNWIKAQFQKSPFAVPLSVIFGVLVLLYFLFPPPKPKKPKKATPSEKTVEEVLGTPEKPSAPVAPPNPPEAPSPPPAATAAPPETPAPEAAPQAPSSQEVAPAGAPLSNFSFVGSGLSREDPFSPLVKAKPAPAVPVVQRRIYRPQLPSSLPPIQIPLPPAGGGAPVKPALKVSVKGAVIDEKPVVFLQIEGEDVALEKGEAKGEVKVLDIQNRKVILGVGNEIRVMGLPGS